MSSISPTSVIAVTSGQPFSDIDALACAIGYAQLLLLQGQPARAVLPGPLNESIVTSIKNWGLDYDQTAPAGTPAILVDVSTPEVIADFAKGHVIEVFDHHSGHENYWIEQIGKNAVHIEFVGACATLIWEEWKRSGHTAKISQSSARLLYTAIASNTLNFKAALTTQRDHKAFAELEPFTNLPKDWIATYYHELEAAVMNNLHAAIVNDTKIQLWPHQNLTVVMGQLERWDGSQLLVQHLDEVKAALASFNQGPAMMTIPSISEGKNYLYAPDPQIQQLLNRAIGATFAGELGQTSKLYLRKEILKALAKLPRS